MDLSVCVVLTALNQAPSLIESIESILSQRRLPDQLGLALGPSLDATDSMAEFYHEEFDFLYKDRKISTDKRGLMELRLGCLPEVEAQHVLFLDAESYLRPDAIGVVKEDIGANGLLINSVEYLRPDETRWIVSPPTNWNPESLLKMGPIPSGMVLWNREVLEEVYSRLQPLQLGPFTTLGWMLIIMDANYGATLCEDALVETWDDTEGDSCWTRSSYRALRNLIELLEELNLRDNVVSGLIDAANNLKDDRIPDMEALSLESENGEERINLEWVGEHLPLPE